MFIVDDYLKNASLHYRIKEQCMKFSHDPEFTVEEQERMLRLAKREDQRAKRDIRDAGVVLTCLIAIPYLIGTALFVGRYSR